MTTALVIAFVGLLVFLAYLFAAFFSRWKVPDVLLLLLIGVALGPALGVVSPETFGAVGPVFTTITLVIILFEGGIGLHLGDVRRAFKGTLALTLSSFVVTAAMVGLLAWRFTDLPLMLSLMLGAILGGTSSIVVMPLISKLHLQTETRAILFLESAITDVLCIVAALGFLEAHKAGEIAVGKMIGSIFAAFLVAVVFGSATALVWSAFLNRVREIQNSIFTTPAVVFVLYGLIELIGFSGAIAALAFGVTLGNIERFNLKWIEKYVPDDPISLGERERLFFSDAVFLLKTFFFVYIGLSIKLADVTPLSVGGMITIAIFLVRIPVVHFALPKSMPRNDGMFAAIMCPKGLAPAVLASIPLQQGIAGGEIIQDITYAVILASIMLNSLLVYLLERTPVAAVYRLLLSRFRAEADA